MFKKFAIAALTLASVTTATLALSGAARADNQWDWRHRHHFSGGNNNWHNSNGNHWSGGQNFHHRRNWGQGPYFYDHYYGGGPFLFGGPGIFYGGPDYGYDYGYGYGYDDGGYWPHRHCHIRKVRRHHHWVSKRVCYAY